MLRAGGFVLGYGLSRMLGVPERQSRTNSIEVGMQVSMHASCAPCTPPLSYNLMPELQHLPRQAVTHCGLKDAQPVRPQRG